MHGGYSFLIFFVFMWFFIEEICGLCTVDCGMRWYSFFVQYRLFYLRTMEFIKNVWRVVLQYFFDRHPLFLCDFLLFLKHGVVGGNVSLFVLHLLFFVITFIEEPCGLCRSRWCELVLLFSLIPFDYVWFFLLKKHVVYVGGEVMLFCRILVVFVLSF